MNDKDDVELQTADGTGIDVRYARPGKMDGWINIYRRMDPGWCRQQRGEGEFKVDTTAVFQRKVGTSDTPDSIELVVGGTGTWVFIVV